MTKRQVSTLCGSLLFVGACGLDESNAYRGDDVPVDTDGSSSSTSTGGDDGAACDVPAAGNGCPHTQGYWKNHNIYGYHAKTLAWPIAETTELCDQTWFDILWTAPKGGNAWIILAHQYIAASLNVASGATTSPEVDAALVDAEGFLAACSISKQDRAAALATSELLDAFNNGDESLGGCGEPTDECGEDDGANDDGASDDGANDDGANDDGGDDGCDDGSCEDDGANDDGANDDGANDDGDEECTEDGGATDDGGTTGDGGTTDGGDDGCDDGSCGDGGDDGGNPPIPK